ncbi:MAG: SDR family NAD(P)-dependent oxidoreductase [Phascolarctobacterium sp.]|nr:SDR family NAD(P)-dependent oxidoreductase [Phascolarctobacterium sp.]
MNKKVIIIGATSGIGREVANIYIAQGWKVGVAGRRAQELGTLRQTAPEQVFTQVLDVTDKNAHQKLDELIEQIGGMDVFLLSSGIGKQNYALEADIELATAATNVEGFIRMTNTAYHYFEKQGHGHLAIISSIAGTKGLGAAAAYSATKRFQSTYMEALEQLAKMNKLNISFTDIRPGFVATPLLKDDSYPLLMKATKVAHQIVKAIGKKKRIAIIDWKYRILVFFWRLIPKEIWLRLPVKK